MQRGRLKKSTKQKDKKRGINYITSDRKDSSSGFLGSKELEKYNSMIEELKIYDVLNHSQKYREFINKKNPSPKDYKKLKEVYHKIDHKVLLPNKSGDLEKMINILTSE